jgi:hypothetical protein
LTPALWKLRIVRQRETIVVVSAQIGFLAKIRTHDLPLPNLTKPAMDSFPDSFDGFQSPFQHLFHTDHVPTEKEVIVSEEIIRRVDNELAELDARRSRLQKIVEESVLPQ